MESIFAAKAKREEPQEEHVVPETMEVTVPMVDVEMTRRPDEMEEIIRAAEEAAYMEVEK